VEEKEHKENSEENVHSDHSHHHENKERHSNENDEIDLAKLKEGIVKFGKNLFSKNKKEVKNEESSEDKELEKKSKDAVNFVKTNLNYFILAMLGIIVWIATKLRLQNLPLLVDVTTGKYVPADLDAFVYLRYAKYMLEHGKFMAADFMRYFPLGHPNPEQLAIEQGFPVMQVYLFKFLGGLASLVTFNFTNSFAPFLAFVIIAAIVYLVVKKWSKEKAIISGISIVYVWAMLNYVFKVFNPEFSFDYLNVIHTTMVFAVTCLFFYLIIGRMFSKMTALIGTTILAFMPPFLFRTMGGVADHDAAGMMFFMIVLYFYIVGWQSKKVIHNIMFGSLAGLTTLVGFFAWPGGGNFLFLIFGTTIVVEVVLNLFKKSDFFVYVLWFVTYFGASLTLGTIAIGTMLRSFTTLIATLAFVLAIVYYVVFLQTKFNLRKKLKINKINLPDGIVSLVIVFLMGVVGLSILEGPGFLIAKAEQMYINLVRPWGISRWHLTVAEQNQPYITDWFGQFGKNFVYLFMFGSVLLFYETIRKIKQSLKKLKIPGVSVYSLTIFYAMFIFAFTFSRYSRGSRFNGTSQQAIVFYIGSLIVFGLGLGILYLLIYYKDKEIFNEIVAGLNKKYILMFIWFVVMIIGARGAIRLLFTFAPVTAIMVAFFFTRMIETLSTVKQKYVKVFGIALLVLMLISPVAIGSYFNNGALKIVKPVVTIGGLIDSKGIVVNYYNNVNSQAKYTGTPYSQQWQRAMQWVRDSTPLDAVFGHWWDYGYWVQTGGERATVTDGGNNVGLWNYYMGRHALIGQNQTEALEFLYAHNVSHFLIISDEIGKYTAFSSIGGGINYERYSWINTYVQDPKQTQETRSGTTYLYAGGQVLDEDFTYNGVTFPGRAAGIGAVRLKIEKEEITQGNQTRTAEKLGQPEIILVYNGQQQAVPLNCVFINNQVFKFEGEGYNGCFRVMPTIGGNGQLQNPIGAGLLVSERGFRAIWTQLYLFNQKNPDYDTSAYKVAYSDETTGMPLAVFNGRLIGPLKIFEITYPEDIEYKPEYNLRTYKQANLTSVTRV
jgi:asparagine N-glycosylation enzyme membrane subunit Stt3